MPQPLSLKIGPSGVRGVVGESLTPQLVTSFAAAFGTYCGAGPIIVGTDTRPSGEMLKQAAIAGLLSVGCTPIDVGIVAVPALMLHVREAGAFGGISVSTSHGSLEWNALKFIGSGGLALRPNQAAELTDLYHQGFYPRVGALDMSDVRADSTTTERHLRAVTGAVDVERIRAGRSRSPWIPEAARRRFLRPGCSRPWAAMWWPSARAPVRHLRQTFSIRRTAIWRSLANSCAARARTSALSRTRARTGSPLSTRAAPRSARTRPSSWGSSAGSSGHRARRRQRRDEPHGGRCGGPRGCPVHRSRVGEANVLEAMTEHGAEVGGEGDGGLIVLPVNPAGTASPPWP